MKAIADGVCDAVVLIVLERAWVPDRRNAEWIERQMRKVAAGVAELEQRLGGAESFTTAGFGLAEIATGCALGYLDLRLPELSWRDSAPHLAQFSAAVATRPSFARTRPARQPIPASG